MNHTSFKIQSLVEAARFAVSTTPGCVPRTTSEVAAALSRALEPFDDAEVSAPADYDVEYAIRAAKREIGEEDRRARIEECKRRLRAKAARPWWAKLFPWRITIERRN